METQLKKPSTNSVGNWTPEEDEVILRYVYEKGKGDEHMMWGNLSETLNGRSGKSCRERWFNHLDPKIKRTEWSQAEQWVLFILRNQTQEKWSLISKKLMGRTDNAVKNYWNSRLKKRIDSMQHAVNQHFQRKRKQKISQMLQTNLPDMNGDAQMQDLSNLLTTEQNEELENYIEKTRTEYLQKILDQVNQQNIEYFENLACEYTLQLNILSKQNNKEEIKRQDKIQEINGYNQYKNNKNKVLNSLVNNDEHSEIDVAGGKKIRFPNNDLDNDEIECQNSQSPYFINNPEVIKMHLDILYKSVIFLSQQKIEKIIENYKQSKELKQKEEEERIQMQVQQKKGRGKSCNYMSSIKRERKQNSAHSKEDSVNEAFNDDANNRSIKEFQVQNKRFYVDSELQFLDSQIKKKVDSNFLKNNGQYLKNTGKTYEQKRRVNQIENQKAEIEVNDSSLQSNHLKCNFLAQNENQSSDKQMGNNIIGKSSPKNKNLKKVIQKMIDQRKQSKLIDKIFYSQKELRSAEKESSFVVDPYIVKQDNILDPQIQNQHQNNDDIEMKYFEKEKEQKVNLKEEKLKNIKKKVHFIVNNKKQEKSKQSSPKINLRLRSSKLLMVNQINQRRHQQEEQIKKVNRKVIQKQKSEKQLGKKMTNVKQNIKQDQKFNRKTKDSQNNISQSSNQITGLGFQNPGYTFLQHLNGQNIVNVQHSYQIQPQCLHNDQYLQNSCPMRNNVMQNITQNIFINYDDSKFKVGSFSQQNYNQDQFMNFKKQNEHLGSFQQPQEYFNNHQSNYKQQIYQNDEMEFKTPKGYPGLNNNCFNQSSQQNVQMSNRERDYIIDYHQIQHENQICITPKSNNHSYQDASVRNLGATIRRTSCSKNESFSCKREKSANNKNIFKTSNFLNQTMTQINQGRDKEINPLYKRKIPYLYSLTQKKPNNQFFHSPVKENEYNFHGNSESTPQYLQIIQSRQYPQTSKKIILNQNPYNQFYDNRSVYPQNNQFYNDVIQQNQVNQIPKISQFCQQNHFFQQNPAPQAFKNCIPHQYRSAQKFQLNLQGLDTQRNMYIHNTMQKQSKVNTPVFKNRNEAINAQPMITSFAAQFAPQKVAETQLPDCLQLKNDYSNDILVKVNKERDRSFSCSNMDMNTPDQHDRFSDHKQYARITNFQNQV